MLLTTTTTTKVVEDFMPLNYRIGYASASVASANSAVEVTYSFDSCDFISSQVFVKGLDVCTLFTIDARTGSISTNASNYAPFVGNYFVFRALAVSAANTARRDMIALKILVVNAGEKSRLSFTRLPDTPLVDFLANFKSLVDMIEHPFLFGK